MTRKKKVIKKKFLNLISKKSNGKKFFNPIPKFMKKIYVTWTTKKGVACKKFNFFLKLFFFKKTKKASGKKLHGASNSY